jgi:tRNA-dihydrouridine synthase B
VNLEQPRAGKAGFLVGSVRVEGDLILSPMDGYSDQPFRSLCRELGSAMSYTEFINALDVLQGNPHLPPRLSYLPSERPVVYQIFDSEPARLLEVALRLQELGPDIIDINMGCSVKDVSGRGAGAGLLRTPEKIAQIFYRLSRALRIPVTGKIRLGWDEASRNYLQIARIIEQNGGALVAVHGRTRSQSYSSTADWDAIAEVRQALSIPVIANGDVRSVAEIERIQVHTGCQGVMIGRAAIGNPWIFSRLDRSQVPPEEVRRVILEHLGRMLDFYGEMRGLVLFRKHVSRYLSAQPLSSEQRQRLLTAARPVEFLQIFESIHP